MHADADTPRHHEMPELVHENEHAKDEHKRKNASQLKPLAT
jgi:hypothetical protein